MKSPVLVIDMGGTNTRFARSRGGHLEAVHIVSNDQFRNIFDLFGEMMRVLAPWWPASCVLAVAAPVDSDYVILTNRAWSFSQRELRKKFRIGRMLVVNDFIAVAHSVGALKASELFGAGGVRSDPRRAVLVCGPGTGFGSALLLKGKNRVHAFASEAGHMRLGAITADEMHVIEQISRETGAVAVEHILSGPGLVRLHRILTGEQAGSEAIIGAAHERSKTARSTIDLFLQFFGRVAGDLALAFDARGGVFIAGGLGRSLGPFIPNSPFRKAFEDHPPYQNRLMAIPTKVIIHETPGLLGAARLTAELPPRG